jgi:tetratricopeptide (TPR) repeat protein
MDKDLESYRQQLEENPHDLEALARLEAELYKRNDFAGLSAIHAERARNLPPSEADEAWRAFVQTLEDRAAMVGDPIVESEICLTLGRIHEEVQGQHEQAMMRYQRAFKLNPRQVEALRAARAIYWVQENWRLVFQLFTLELQVTTEPTAQADLYFQMAEVCAERLGEAQDAALCVRSALKLVPDHPRAGDFKALVESVHGHAQAEIDALLAQADAAKDPRQKVAAQLAAADVWIREAADEPRLEALLQQILATDPRNEQARVLLEQVYEAAGRWQDLSKLLEARIEATPRKPDRLALYLRIAELASGPMNDPEAAARAYREVLNLEPGESVALSFCVEHYGDAQRWADLVSIYEAALRSRARAGSEGAMLVQIAMLLWKKVGDLEQAENYFKRIKLNDPKNLPMLQFYAEYYTAQADWKKLIATLTARQAAEVSVEARVDIGLKMAQVAELQLDNPEKAIDIWKSILKLKADHDVARGALRRLFTQTQKWNALLEFLKEDLNLVVGDDATAQRARVEIYLRMIEIYRDRLSLDVMVVNTYNLVLQADPTHVEALDALEARFEESARWNDLIGILKRRAEAARTADDNDAYIGHQRRIAQLWIEKFSNPNQAITHLESILELRPQDETAIGQLIEIYRHRKDWRPLFAIYRRQLDVLEGAGRVERLTEMAKIAAERLDEKDEAIGLWREVLVADPLADKAWQSLEQLYLKTERWSDLAQLFADQASRAEDPALRIGWLKRLGNVYSDRLRDEDHAAETWRAVLRASPGDLHAENYLRELHLRRSDWNALESLYGERGDWEGLVRLLAGRAADATEVAVKVELYKRMARICHLNLENESAAIECWERVLREDPTQTDAARTLAPYYVRTEQWDALVYVLEILLAHTPENPVELLVDLAQVHELRRGDVEQAFLYWARALQSAPERLDLLAEARRTAAATRRQDALCDLLGALCDTVDDAEVEVRFRGVLAEICADDLGRFPEAAVHLERVRALSGDTDGVLEALGALYQRLAAWDELLGIYGRQFERAEAPDEQARILAEMGRLHETVREDAPAAQRAYEQLLDLAPRNLEAVRGLQRLAERGGDLGALVGHLDAELALTSEPLEVASLQYRAGQLEERLGRTADALGRYERVLTQVPDHPGAVTSLENALTGPLSARAAQILEPHMRLFERWPGLRRVLELQVQGSTDPSFRARLLREVATLREGVLADASGAFSTWERLLLEDRHDGSVVAALERLASELGAWDALADLYGSLALGGSLAGDDVPTAAVFSRRLAVVLEERLARPLDARTTLLEVIHAQGEELDLLEVVDRLSARLEDWQAVVEVCEQKLTLVETQEARVALLHRLADLYEEVLDRPDLAIEAYKRVLTEEPTQASALDALDRLYRQSNRWEELANLLQVRLDDATDAARIPLSYQLAGVLEAHLGRHAEALEHYSEVLDLAPDHDPTLEALVRFIDHHAGPDAVDLRRRACDILEPVFVARDAWAHEVALLRVRLEDAADAAERVGLRRRIAQRCEVAGQDPQTAFSELRLAFDEAFADEEILRDLLRLAEETQGWGVLVQSLATGLEPSRAVDLETDRRRALLGLMARLRADRCADVKGAIADWLHVLELWSEDDEALAALDGLYERAGDAEALVGVVRRRAALADAPAERMALLLRLADLQETVLAQPEAAVETFSGLRLEVPSEETRAHVALARLNELLERWEALAEVLEDHAERAVDEGERRALLFRAAAVHDVRLGRGDEAIRLIRAVLADAPEELRALAELDRLLTEADDVVGLLEVLERRAATAADAGARHDFEFRRAELLGARLGETERALAIHRALLASDPGYAPSRRALEALLSEPEHRLVVARILMPIYAAEGHWVALRDVSLAILPDLETDEARITTLVEIAGLEEHRLSEPARALAALADAWRLSGATPDLEPELHRLAAGLGAWGPLVELLGEGVTLAPERSVELRMARASIFRDALADATSAIGELRAALELEPEHTAVLDALDRLYGAQGDVSEQIEIIDRKTGLEQDEDARKALLHRIAVLQEGSLADGDAAIETHRRVILLDASDPVSLEELERLLLAAGRHAELAALYEHRASLPASREAQADLEFKLARVCQIFLSDGARALDLYRGILADLPRHGPTRDALRALFADERASNDAGLDRQTVGDVLEPLYRDESDWASLVEVLEVRQASSADPVSRFEVLRELAQIWESRLGDAAAAFDATARAYRIQPDHEENRATLRRLGETGGRVTALTGLLEEAVDASSDTELQVALLLELGLIEELQRENDLGARNAYRRVLTIEPGQRTAVSALVDLYSRTAAWDDLVDLYVRLADESTDPDEKKTLLLKVCQLFEDVLDDVPRAIDTWRRVHALEPENAAAYRALERFYTQVEAWDDLAELRREEIRHAAAAPRRAELTHRLAELIEGRLRRPDEAVELWAGVLADDDPAHAPTIAALERLQLECANAEPESPLRLRIAQILEPIYESAHSWPEWVGVLEVQLHFEGDRWRRVEALTRIAEAYEHKLAMPSAAFTAWTRAFAEDYGNADVMKSMDRLAAQLAAWRPLVDAYIGGIAGFDDVDGATAILLKVARIWDRELGEAGRAIDCYQRVLQVDEANAESLNALERLLASERRFADLVTVLVRKADFAREVLERKELLYRVCELSEQVLAQPTEAIATYRRILEEDAEDQNALEALVRLYERTANWPLLVEVLREKLELSSAESERKELLFRIARVCEDHLGDANETILTFRSVLEVDPGDRRAIESLDRLFSREGRWGELIDLLERDRAFAHEEASEESAERIDVIDLRIADTLERHLGQTEQAVEIYGELLARTPDSRASIEALERVLGDERHRLSASRMLEPHYQRVGEPDRLARIYELQLLDLVDRTERIDLLKRLAALRYGVLKHPRSAFEAYLRAFQEDPGDDEVIEALHELASELQSHDALAGAYEEQITASIDTTVVANLTRRLARLCDERLDRPERAVEAWQSILRVDPYDREALAALDRLYQARQDWERLIDVLRREIDLGGHDEETDLRFRLGYLLEVVQSDLGNALELYRGILADRPEHVFALEAMERLAVHLEFRSAIAETLEPVYRQTGAFAKLCVLTEMKIELTGSASERAALWMQSAELRESRLQDADGALECLLRALDEAPMDEDVRSALIRVATERGAWERLAAAFDAVRTRITDHEMRVGDLLRVAEWSRGRLRDAYRAAERYVEVLGLEPDNQRALDALEEIYAESEVWNRLAEVYRRKAELTYDLDEKRRRLAQLAELCAVRLKDTAQAVVAWEDILRIDPSDVDALNALEALHELAGDAASLYDVLRRRLDTTYDGIELAVLHRRMATIARDDLRRPTDAAESLEKVLECDPEDLSASAELRTLYAELGAWDRLQDVLVKELSTAATDEDRLPLLAALGENAETRLGRVDSAIEYQRQRLGSDPSSVPAMDALSRLYSASERWFDLVEALREHLATQADPDSRARRVQLLVLLADVAHTHLQDAEVAITALNEVLGLEPYHARALTVLAQLYERGGEWERCAETLVRALQYAAAGAERADAQRRLGLLYLERLDRPSEAQAALKAAVEETGDPAALQALIQLAAQRGDVPEQIALVERRLQAAGRDVEARSGDLLVLAGLHAEAGQADARILRLEEAVSLRPGDARTADALLEAYFAAGRSAEAEPLLRRTIERLKGERRFKELFGYNFQMGRVAEEKGDDTAALAHYQECFDYDATHLPNLLRLGKLHFKHEQWEKALKIFTTMLLHQMNIESTAQRVEIFYHLGVLRQKTGDARKARDMFNRALGLDPEHAPSRDALETL